MAESSQSSPDIPHKVANLLLRDADRDQYNEVYQLSLRLSRLCNQLGVDAIQSQTGFRVPLSGLALDILKLEQYKSLLKQLESKSDEIEGALKTLDRKYEEGKQSKKEFQRQSVEYKQEYEMSCKRMKQYKGEMIEIQKKLDEIGYDQSLGEESIGNLKNEIANKEATLAELTTQLNQFEGLEPSNEAIKKRIQEMKDELNNFNILNDSNLFE